jgi:hypothetical protein
MAISSSGRRNLAAKTEIRQRTAISGGGWHPKYIFRVGQHLSHPLPHDGRVILPAWRREHPK